MASVTRRDENGRSGFRIRFYCDKQRREIYLAGSGKRAERMATSVAGHCESLAQAKANNVPADPAAVAWASGTEGKLRENLVTWGLADPVNPKLVTDEGRLLGPFVDAYLASRTDWAKKTGENHRQVNNYLKQYFGPACVMKAITIGDAERWHRWLSESCGLSPATVSKHGKRAKMMFEAAVKDRLLPSNPFATLKAGKESNSDRHRFIDPGTSAKVLAACPNAEWRLIFSLCRWGGLRCPSEVVGLRWSDVDWATGRMRIDSQKTGVRFCPIFPEIRLALDESFSVAPDGAMYCVGRYRDRLMNLRTQFGRIVERAGLVPWPKPFVNLRSTRRTELQERFPDHVVNAWLGHSGIVAAKHYLQITDEHWGRAIDSGSPTGSPIANNLGPSEAITERGKPNDLLGFDGRGGLLMGGQYPRQDSNL